MGSWRDSMLGVAVSQYLNLFYLERKKKTNRSKRKKEVMDGH